MHVTPIFKTKTFRVGMGAILTAGAAYLTGGISLGDLIVTTTVSLVGIFLRKGVAK